jgi:transcriptional regulator with XRE-family HTH domain
MGRRKRTDKDLLEASSIGAKLREARELARLTQAELGAKIGRRSQRTVSKYEAGESSIPLSVLLKICEELNVGLEWFIEGIGPEFYATFKGDQTRRRGRALFEGLRAILLSELHRVKQDSSLPQDVKKSYEIAVERLKYVPHNELGQDVIVGFIWDLLRTRSVLRRK